MKMLVPFIIALFALTTVEIPFEMFHKAPKACCCKAVRVCRCSDGGKICPIKKMVEAAAKPARRACHMNRQSAEKKVSSAESAGAAMLKMAGCHGGGVQNAAHSFKDYEFYFSKPFPVLENSSGFLLPDLIDHPILMTYRLDRPPEVLSFF